MSASTPASGVSPDSDRRFLRSVAWTAAAKWGSQIASWASTIIVARLLSLSDYGIFGIGMVYLGLMQMLSEFGIASAITNLRELTHEQLAQLNSFAVLISFVAVAASAALAWPMGWFFHSNELPWLITALSANFVLFALQSVPMGKMQRDLRYREIGFAEGLRSISMAILIVALAYAGFGYWALVIGNVVSLALSTVLLLSYERQAFATPHLKVIRTAVVFSGQVAASRIAWYSWSNADFVVAGRFLGAGALGAYTLAWNIASLPVEKITTIILKVTAGFFSEKGVDASELRRRALNVTEGLAITTFPFAIGLACVADPFVRILLGNKWEAAIPVLRLLAIVSVLRCLTPVLNQVLVRSKLARFEMWRSVQMALAMPIGFVVGAQWGIIGIAATWLILFPLLSLILLRKAFLTMNLSAMDYLRPLVAPALSSGIMAATVFAVRMALSGYGHPVALLAIEVVVGAAVYSGCMWWLARERVRALLHKLRAAA
jgi:teichuronic acid exporter